VCWCSISLAYHLSMFRNLIEIADCAFSFNPHPKYLIQHSALTFVHKFLVSKFHNSQDTENLCLWRPCIFLDKKIKVNSTEDLYSYCIYLDQMMTGYRYSSPCFRSGLHSDIADRLHLACFWYSKRYSPEMDSILDIYSTENEVFLNYFRDICNAIIIRDKPKILYNLIMSFKYKICNTSYPSGAMFFWLFERPLNILRNESESLYPYTVQLYSEDILQYRCHTKTWQWILRSITKKFNHDIAQNVMLKYATCLAKARVGQQLEAIATLA